MKKGTPVDVSCVTGFSLTGDRTITCVQDADFNSPQNFPSCSIDKCTGLSDEMFDLMTNIPLPVDYGTRVELDCIQGYSLSGSSLITCIKEKNWQYEDTPHCVLGEIQLLITDLTTVDFVAT